VSQNIGLQRGLVRLAPYDASWKHAFETERDELRRLLGDLVQQIEHVGSTSVPGLSAKPIIDIALGIDSVTDVDGAVRTLVAAGYVDRGRQGERHLVAKGPEQRRTHYIHLVEQHASEWRQMLLFRDYLISNSDRARTYEALKEGLAARFPTDRNAYANAKDAFIEETLALASGK
jgi:GrpB-like predicted nucleotidyltransferase (UPF0157 family)